MSKRFYSILLATILCICFALSGYTFAEGDCTHSSTTTYLGIYKSDEMAFEYIDETTHLFEGQKYDITECLICYVTISETPTEFVSRTENHNYKDGICRCGATEPVSTCDHPEEYVETERYLGFESATPVDAKNHEQFGYYIESWKCQKCGEREYTYTDEYDSKLVKHYFEDGVCVDCGYQNTCVHPEEMLEVYNYPEDVTYEPIDGNSQKHLVTGQFIEITSCQNCETVISEVPNTSSEYEYHTFENDSCIYCGYENDCEHQHTRSVNDYLGTSYEYFDNEYHTMFAESFVKITYCEVCGTDLSVEPLETDVSKLEEHFFDNGVCYLCGARNSCEHPEDKITITGYAIFDDTYEFIDEKSHKITYREAANIGCSECGEFLYREAPGEIQTAIGNHAYTTDGEYCVFCGYENSCTHPEESYVYDYFVDDENKQCIAISQTTCTWQGMTYAFVSCGDCGYVIDEYRFISENGTATYKHYFEDNVNVCVYCGYEEVSVIPSDEPTTNPTVEPTTKPTDEPSVEPTEEPSVEPTTEPVVETTEQPIIIDIPKPTTVAPTAAPTATEVPVVEIVYVEAESNVVVNGVKAEDSLPMVEVVLTVAQSVVSESETAELRIVNIENIISVEEKVQLEKLPIEEQLLVALSALGFNEVITGSLESSGLELSEEAVVLMENIDARLAAMTDDERIEFTMAMQEYFPIETIEIDGIEYDYFVLQFEIIDNGEVSHTAYGFRFDEETSEWLLIKLYMEEI